MWDVKKYKQVLNRIKEEGSLKGVAINSKENIYDEIAKLVFVNRETAKSWTRPTSTGPKDIEIIRHLEKTLDLPIYSLEQKTEKEENEAMINYSLTDVNKNAIFRCYEIMKDYLHDDDMESEECFNHMWSELEKYKILIPKELYKKISDFNDEVLAPIVYDSRTTYANCYTEEIGFINEEGIWEIRSEEAAKQFCMNFMLKNIEIEEQLDAFAMKELQPFLV